LQTLQEHGKYLTKRNTFSDFIACAEKLVEDKYTTPMQMACEGRSAGGLLVGAVANMRPDLFRCIVAGVPFVDLMVTMCDATIPLTTNEWYEWGNPNARKYYDYMLSYSPLDNVRAQPYPHIVITAGLSDPRVAYWEPAKWASKLRHLKTEASEADGGPTVVVAKFDLDSGHFSASDRYKYLREKAFDQSFVLDKLGLLNTPSRATKTDAK
jgi:oligopeptidase B